MNAVENEIHFITQCSLYDTQRVVLFNRIMNLNRNFVILNDTEKAKWMLLQEDLVIPAALGTFTSCCFEKRNNKVKLDHFSGRRGSSHLHVHCSLYVFVSLCVSCDLCVCLLGFFVVVLFLFFFFCCCCCFFFFGFFCCFFFNQMYEGFYIPVRVLHWRMKLFYCILLYSIPFYSTFSVIHC